MIEIKRNWNLKILMVLCIMLSATLVTQAQDGLSKKAITLFNKGLKHQGYGEYSEAIACFKQAVKKEPGFVDAYDALANTYQKNKDTKSAIRTYNKLLSLKPDHYYALYELGKIYFQQEKIDSAEYYYRSFLNVNKTNNQNAKNAQITLQNISFGKVARKNPVDITLKNMGPNINTREQEYSPAFAIDEQTMYITRRVGDLSDNRPNEDIYYATKDGEDWTPIKNLGSPINTVENEGAFSVSADGHYIFFTSCSRPGGKGQCDIWLTIDKNGRWSEPMNLQAPVNSKHWESQPSIASNGKVLYFTSDRPGGYGGTDIWKAHFGANGWEKPVNLGPEINTSLDEQFPFIHSDNSTLYFSSEGHPGMGKSDLFITRLKPDGKWDTPKNLGYPINSTGYDWNMIVTRDGSTAYYSSDNVTGGEGGLDIYSFELPEELRAKRVSYIKGLVIDAQTKKPLSANILLTPIDGGESTGTYADGVKGQFLSPLKADERYALTIDKKGYLFHSEYFDMPNLPSDKPFELTIELKKIEVGKSVVLNNLFFDTDQFFLKPESKSELTKFYEFLASNTEIHVEISGHTDNVGGASHNQVLSQNRAKAVFDYLIKEGISSDRITYKGYGDSSPISTNDTKEGRAINRRTEFRIIN